MNKFNKTGIYTALISIIIGTLFLIVYVVTGNDDIAFYGFIYLISAFIINAFIALILLFIAIPENQKNRIKIIKTIGVMLLNIPIAYLYIVIVFNLLEN